MSGEAIAANHAVRVCLEGLVLKTDGLLDEVMGFFKRSGVALQEYREIV